MPLSKYDINSKAHFTVFTIQFDSPYTEQHKDCFFHVDACGGCVLLEREGQKGSKSLCMICFEGTAADSSVNV